MRSSLSQSSIPQEGIGGVCANRKRPIDLAPRARLALRRGRHPQSWCARIKLLDTGKTDSKRGKTLRLNRDNAVLDRILHELGICFYLQEVHHAVLVRSHS